MHRQRDDHGPCMIDGVIVTPLKIIGVPEGDVLHAMKCSDVGFSGFGEAYFSTIKADAIKAWKRHRKMTLNLVVPVGAVRFVIFDDRNGNESFQEIELSKKNYCRLTVPPMVWMGFQGRANMTSMLMNIANIPHDPGESDGKSLHEIKYNWSSS